MLLHLATITDATVALQELTVTADLIAEEIDSAVIAATLVEAQQSPMHNSVNGENLDSVQALASRHTATSTQAVSLPNAHDSCGTSQPLHCSGSKWLGLDRELSIHLVQSFCLNQIAPVVQRLCHPRKAEKMKSVLNLC